MSCHFLNMTLLHVFFDSIVLVFAFNVLLSIIKYKCLSVAFGKGESEYSL